MQYLAFVVLLSYSVCVASYAEESKAALTDVVVWKKAANQGDTVAQILLGDYYHGEQGGTQDLEQAVVWYRKAADQGNADAQNHLGDCFFSGEGVSLDHELAVVWYRKAAAQGNAEAQNHLGDC